MLVRRVFGPYAGDVIDMDYVDAVAAIKGNSVTPVSPEDIERFSVRQVADAAGAMAAPKQNVSKEIAETGRYMGVPSHLLDNKESGPSVDTPKRKGGWPLGKKRG